MVHFPLYLILAKYKSLYFQEMIGTLRAFDYEDFQPLVDKRSGSASDEMSPEELDLCTMGSVPQIVNMKRMISMDSRVSFRMVQISVSLVIASLEG